MGVGAITKHHSEEDRWLQGQPVEDRQTLLDASLALSRVFLEFTDKKCAGGRHHQRLSVTCVFAVSVQCLLLSCF